MEESGPYRQMADPVPGFAICPILAADCNDTWGPFWRLDGKIWMGYQWGLPYQSTSVNLLNPLDLIIGIIAWLRHGIPHKWRAWRKYRNWICACGNCHNGRAICRILKRK
jgi:hypothetical protein